MKDFNQARTNMVKNQVMTNNVFNHNILDAMQEVPRHEFIEGKWREMAYLDARLPLDKNRKMLEPAVFARMLDVCGVSKDDSVLDVACGSGYSTAIIAKLAKKVIGLESINSLAIKAADYVKKEGLNNVAIKSGNLLAGAPENAPYDIIIINGALNKAPDELLMQLKNKGKLVFIEHSSGIMKAVKYTLINSSYNKVELFDAYAELL
ncbi:protein-L-isoaspartate O-methyltransferase [endosymbiont of Acanthamoeba sp. UWC8]|uniref:protein-L-isoaspartate O-methyltransferase family protein n=1 Tax=endosymbiont of Acanthamoeba sp. UWC8 TaxID=86106 RepID=UPI0004D1EC72|nr:protein-L-isoaspartate O-methyltransferase [endosymbiont of Acanthamoeba sp. UWC8]AIF80990.1 protein-L-isoaspartate O-methyltransferase [endosymbiont of Acanthamoeba sp. UWC8]